jgi:methionyl aminopeptidase
MALAIEPMINIGSDEVRELSDGWTVKTGDGSLSAHYENTVILVGDEVLNLTLIDPQF